MTRWQNFKSEFMFYKKKPIQKESLGYNYQFYRHAVGVLALIFSVLWCAFSFAVDSDCEEHWLITYGIVAFSVFAALFLLIVTSLFYSNDNSDPTRVFLLWVMLLVQVVFYIGGKIVLSKLGNVAQNCQSCTH
jgi:hypothetical protein